MLSFPQVTNTAILALINFAHTLDHAVLIVLICCALTNFYIVTCENISTITTVRILRVKGTNRTILVAGDSVSFKCYSGLLLSGPNMTTCMQDGMWYPDPREVECRNTCKQLCET